jgi:large subunit ribosomal protein L4
MKVDVVNAENKKVGTVELSDDVFAGRVNTTLIWEAVVHANASDRRGTHATKSRGMVSGSGRKPWKQKGTGRARIGSIRNPIWRHGGTVFGPSPRSYGYALPLKMKRGGVVAALAQKVQDGSLVVIDSLSVAEGRTKSATELLKKLGADGKALLIDVKPDEKLGRAVRNLAGVHFLASSRVGARDLMNATRVIATKAAIEKLQGLLV